ncbi:MFS transporter [Brevibacillus sp. AY1]|uniref:MFS transporter n=1 Tax=Brevibacillus sp. AY1 TaxID=2807621 RepID=UPI0024581C8E|nr:MFS transporter [Brevibacillus sp. AY1]
MTLLKNKRYAAGLELCVLVMGMGFSLPFLTPQLLAEVNQLEAGWIGFAMVPAAVVSALLARSAGKLADQKGNSQLFHLGGVLYLISFLLLSVFVGIAPVFVALLLIFGTVGQLFIQISMSNAISRTLSKEQTGVGMGLFSMVGFLSGAVSTGIYSKAVDYGAATYWIPWNPYANAAVFSNIYLALIVMTALILVIFRYFFSKETVTNIHKG